MLFFSSLHRNLAHPVVLLVLALILVPTLFLPLGIDQSIFARGGEVLFGNGKLYADYFEQKPPLLFLFYGVGKILFGNSDISYRTFDFIWQLFTVFSLLFCVKRITKDQASGVIAAGIYAILYCSMGSSETMECESFIAPALVWLLYLSSIDSLKITKSLLLRGALAGFCFGMKFTFGITLIAILFWEIIETKEKLIRNLLLLSIGFTVAAIFSMWAFFDPFVLNGYFRVLEYTIAYSGNPPINSEFFRTALVTLGHFFGDNISLTVTIAAALGVGISIKDDNKDLTNETGRLIRISVYVLFALLLSIIIERKFNPYHFLRIYIPLSILASIGIAGILRFLYKRWNSLSFSWRLIVVVIGFFALLMSPIPRCFKNLRIAYLYCTSKESYWLSFQKPDDPALVMVDARNIASFIKSNPQKGKTFVIATAASYIYRQLDEHPLSKFSMPMYYYATTTPKGAYQEMLQEVFLSKWIVVQTNDIHPALYGHTKSSWECVHQDSVMFNYLNTNFTKVKEIGAFYVFERKE